MTIETRKDMSRLARQNGRRAGSVEARWWAVDNDVHEHVWSVADRIEAQLTLRQKRMYMAELLYSDTDALSSYRPVSKLGGRANRRRITLNVIQNAIDTLGSMIAKTRPRPLFLTDGADYSMRRRAELLTKVVGSQMREAGLYEVENRRFTQGSVYGTGFLYLFNEKGASSPSAELVSPREMLVDDVDGHSGKPQQMHRRRLVDLPMLETLYPNAREVLERAAIESGSGADQTVSEAVWVLESWRLPSRKGAGDGRYTVTIKEGTLLDQGYERMWHPIFPWRWYEPLNGFWGRSVVDEIEHIQNRINYTIQTIDESLTLLGVPLWLVEETARVNPDHLQSNVMGRMVQYFQNKPEPVMPPSVPPDVFQHLQWLVQQAYQVVGLNQQIAQGQKPAGVESGAAIREVDDIASGRFQLVAQRREESFVELADAWVELCKELYEPGDEIAALVEQRGDLLRVKWRDVDMERDKFKITVFPASALPTHPAGRMQTAIELTQEGFITKEQSMELLGFPDIEQAINRETASLRLVESQIARLKDGEKFGGDLMPLAEMNLALAHETAAKEIVLAKTQGLPDDVLEEIRRYGEACADLMKPQKAAEQQAMAMAGPPPGAPPPGPPPAPLTGAMGPAGPPLPAAAA